MNDKEKLLVFLMSWYYWATVDENYFRFNKAGGLCINAALFFDNEPNLFNMLAVRRLLESYLKADFKENFHVPFNTCTETYKSEARHRTQHLNPRRLAWVRKMIIQLQHEIQGEQND